MRGLSESSGLPEKSKVSVLDVDNRHISFTHPAKARRLLREGKASVFSINPFIIKLKGERRVSKMKQFTRTVKSFTDYFREERDVYVQNLSNTQVSLQFGEMPNISSVLIPETRKPYNLSQHVPFRDLKNSVDLRKMINRRPPTLVLMDEQEFEKFYKDLAVRNGTTMDEEISTAYEQQIRLMSRTVRNEDEKAKSKKQDEEIEEKAEKKGVDPTPNPKIVGMCVEGSGSSADIIDKLKMMEDDLSITDLEYMHNNMTIKTVKKWVDKKLSEAVSNNG